MSRTKASYLAQAKKLGLEFSEARSIEEIKAAIADAATDVKEDVEEVRRHDEDPDPNSSLSLDQKITPNPNPGPMPTFDISQPVTPGHDMVMNHLDGSQELGTGAEVSAATALENATGQNVPLSSVNVADETTARDSDPEVNGPDQQSS